MKNPAIVEIIKERFQDLKTSSEYRMQLCKIVDLEDKFVKDFDKAKWREYFNLDLEKCALHELETEELIDFAVEFLYINSYMEE